eukprot:m51a1_g6528 hypothetical protein (73) ;mRNA; r:11790-12008
MLRLEPSRVELRPEDVERERAAAQARAAAAAPSRRKSAEAAGATPPPPTRAHTAAPKAPARATVHDRIGLAP